MKPELARLVKAGDLDVAEAEALMVAASHAAHGNAADAMWHARMDVSEQFRDINLTSFAAGAAFAWAMKRPDVEPASYRAAYRPR
ncbi:hypothetical protein J2Y63_005397 [Shinella sp. BE166]|uniref:hypothetical protein n=1 Tax=Shinella sp. BE166 TaxID=3373918 RepID=UPI003EBF1FA9